MNKRIKISLFILGIIFLITFYSIYPFGLPNANRYFDPIDKRALQKDEIGQFNYVYNTYELMDITGTLQNIYVGDMELHLHHMQCHLSL